MYTHGLIAPVLVLVAWTLLVWIWMYATRLPAFQKAGIAPQDAKHPGTYADRMPTGARQIADNYNHLHEQPTIFYALALALQLAGQASPMMMGLAWGYVATRIVHSLIQNTVNIVLARFLIFALGTIVLIVMTVHGLMAVL
jgi:hypothetical protein